VSASRDTTLKIWSLKAGRSSDSCDATLGAHMAPVVSLAFDPASHFVTSGSQDGICRVWNLAGQATSVSTLSGHVGDVRSLALFTTVSANESRQVIRVVSGGADGTVKVWNAADGSLIADLDGHTGLVGHVLAVTSDSRAARTLVTAGVDGMIKAWEMSGTPRLQWVQNMAHENGVTSLHSNGKHVISGGADSKVRVWELQTGRMVKELGENFDAIYKVSCKQGRDNGNIVVARQHGSAMLYVD
jgi:F-box and WD-40 domain protein CDC4